MKLDSAGAPQPGFPRPTFGIASRGVAVTPVDNNIWVANSNSNTVTRFDNAGSHLATILVGATPTGVAVDANGKVWVTNYSSGNAMRIDPSTNSVDLTVPLGPNSYPYNYSDMTGAVVTGSTSPQGLWTIVHDGGVAGMEWGTISWNAAVPGGSSVIYTVTCHRNQMSHGL